jgi:uncharacterized lipoprotein
MTPVRVIVMLAGALACSSMAACGGSKVDVSCDEPQAYQAVVPSKRVEAPEGLDQLDDFKEMPIPEATTPPRPEGSRCIESAPSALTGTPDNG